jgi:hypothetical protein
MSKSKCETILIFQEIDGEELELTVYFEIKNTQEVIEPICTTCGGSLNEPWLLMEIGKIVKVVDTTNTTNQSAEEEKIFPKNHPYFDDVVNSANASFRYQQECPEIECVGCITKSSKPIDNLFDSEGHMRQ